MFRVLKNGAKVGLCILPWKVFDIDCYQVDQWGEKWGLGIWDWGFRIGDFGLGISDWEKVTIT